MLTKTEKRKLLEIRWRNTLSTKQREAWALYAASGPKLDDEFKNQTVTGKQMYVLCNLPNVQKSC